MKKNVFVISAGLAVLCLSTPLYAQEEEGEGSAVTVEDASCQSECPEGQVKVTFADGSKVSCACTEASTGMVETVEGEGGGCVDADDNGVCDE